MKSALRLRLGGLVQGVGMRPWVLQQAHACGVFGSVRNTNCGVEVLIEGESQQIQRFRRCLIESPPSGASINYIEVAEIAPSGATSFYIDVSNASEPGISPWPRDAAPCAACLAEMRDPHNRRFQYPFISCASCGPRFSIIEALPFDRQRTSMRAYHMCDACREEYDDPEDRRCHAQTIACEHCGPQLWLTSNTIRIQGSAPALEAGLECLRGGNILALKGVGGYQLIARADSEEALAQLRRWKQRRRKPLAVMLRGVEDINKICHMSAAERRELRSPGAPIVLLEVRAGQAVPPSVAPGLKQLGVMCPASPLHQLLADGVQSMLVVTSANRRGEPLIVDDAEALELLPDIAHATLGHDRPIVHMADDSVVRYAGEQRIVMRHARGLAPTNIALSADRPINQRTNGLAYGGHIKTAAAVCQGNTITLLQHVGDMDSVANQQRLRREAEAAMTRAPDWVAVDAHPDYGSRLLASEKSLPVREIYHHVAHVLAVVAEHQLTAPVLGVAFDGTGLGADGSIWGGEFIAIDPANDGLQWRRVASILDFPLPGGEAAIKQPRRAALGLAWRMIEGRVDMLPECVRRLFTTAELDSLVSMLRADVNCPRTSSIGRMFDALAACGGLCAIAEYDGEAALALENAADGRAENAVPTLIMNDANLWDWRPLLAQLMRQLDAGCCVSGIASVWHAALADLIAMLAKTTSYQHVALCGGVFQNARLVGLARDRLLSAGKRVYCHTHLPANDGSLAVGQAYAAAMGVHRVGFTQTEEHLKCV